MTKNSFLKEDFTNQVERQEKFSGTKTCRSKALGHFQEIGSLTMSQPKVLGCLVSVGGTHAVYYHVLDRHKVNDLSLRLSFQEDKVVNANTLMERIHTAHSNQDSLSMSHGCEAYYLKQSDLHIALIIECFCTYPGYYRINETLKEIASEISALFEEENDDIPLYILRIRCRSITAPIIRRFNRKSTVKCIYLQTEFEP